MASLGFYAWGEPLFVFLMIIEIVLVWGLGIFVSKKDKSSKPALILSIVLLLSVLFVFKYLSFVASELGLLFGTGTNKLDIALPIGISFFTFQLISYIVDVYNGTAKVQKNLFYLGLYVSLFPQLIAGPIVRYNQIYKEIECREQSWDNVVNGFTRFIYGLGKKVLIANYVAQVSDYVFDTVSEPSAALAWFGAIAYTMQIYFDFSGYSDMAIGLGRMFGFHFEENFNYPYISRTVNEFWRRWHISLSTWFRDYVYIPLGGNRCSKSRWVWNMLVVWLLTGIWHGANWTFVVWGLFYFLLLVIERLSGFTDRIGRFGHVYTMFAVIVAWVLFRSASITDAWQYLLYMFGGSKQLIGDDFLTILDDTWLMFLLAFIGCTPVINNVVGFLKKRRMEWLESIWLFLVFIFALIKVIGSTYNPFIYFNF